MAQRILFLISDTGGGHRASANALVEAFTRLHGAEVQCQLVDLFAEYGHWPLSWAPQVYSPLVARYGWLWRLLWWAGAQPSIWRLTCAVMLAWHRGRLRRCFEEHPADLVVSVHPLLNHVPRRVLRRLHPRVPFATVVTDLRTAHRTWCDPAVDLLCVSCAEAQQQALAAGVPAERIRLLGLPISLKFENQPGPAGRRELRRQLGLLDRPTVLVMGGGEGMGPVAEIAQAIAAELADRPAQLVVICGRNKLLAQRLRSRHWPIPARVLGFVDNAPQWMGAADCIVTKAGPGAIAEALASGLPILLSGFVPGQEEGNVGYVVEQGVGAFSQDPAEIGRLVRRWLEPDNPALAAMSRRAWQLARPQAALEIAQALSELL